MCQSTPTVLPAHRSTPIAYLTGDCVYTVSLTPTNPRGRSRRQALCMTTFGRVFASTNSVMHILCLCGVPRARHLYLS